MTIVVASNNPHKIREFKEILNGHEVVAPSHFGLRFEHDETGDTFAANALGKAQTMYGLLRRNDIATDAFAVVSDDSGLVVPALGGAPGVYSARYGAVAGGRELDDTDRNHLLLANMKDIGDRAAYYVCCMVLALGPDRFVCVQDTWHGTIAHGLSEGSGGFGYDPLFIVPDYAKTVADIGNEVKAKISHRAKAVRLLQPYLRESRL